MAAHSALTRGSGIVFFESVFRGTGRTAVASGQTCCGSSPVICVRILFLFARSGAPRRCIFQQKSPYAPIWSPSAPRPTKRNTSCIPGIGMCSLNTFVLRGSRLPGAVVYHDPRAGATGVPKPRAVFLEEGGVGVSCDFVLCVNGQYLSRDEIGTLPATIP